MSSSQQPQSASSEYQQTSSSSPPTSGLAGSGGGMGTSSQETSSMQQQQQPSLSSSQQRSESSGMGTSSQETSSMQKQQQPSLSSSQQRSESSGMGGGTTGSSQGMMQGQQQPTTGMGGGMTQQPMTEAIPTQIATAQPTTSVAQGQPSLGGGKAAAVSVSRYIGEGQMPHMNTVFITGATGSTGTAVLKQLSLMKQRPFNVVVGAHGSVTDEQRQFWNQFEKVMPLNADDVNSLDFRGVNELLLIPSNSERRIQHVQNYVNAAKQCGVKFIVLISTLGTDFASEETRFTQEFKRIENIVEESDIPCCFLRCNFYMENLFLQTESIATNKTIVLPFREGRWAPISVHDVACVACCILSHPEPHINKAYDLAGPNLVTGNFLANCLSECLNDRFECQTSSPQEYVDVITSHGVSNWLARGMADYLCLFDRDRRFDSIDSQAFFKDLTGENMTSVRQWCQENAEFFRNQISRIQQQMQKAKPKTMMGVGAPGIQQPQMQEQQRQQPGITAGGRDIDVGGEGGVNLQKLRSLLHELISERSEFSMEERQFMERNEQKLRSLHQLEKQLSKMALQQQGPTGEGGLREETEQPQQQMRQPQQQPSYQPERPQQQQPSYQPEKSQQQQQPSWAPERGVRESGFAGGRGAGVAEGGYGGPGMLSKIQEYGKPVSSGAGGMGGGLQSQQQQQRSGGGYGYSQEGQQQYGGTSGYPQRSTLEQQQQQPMGGYGKEATYSSQPQAMTSSGGAGGWQQQPSWQQEQPQQQEYAGSSGMMGGQERGIGPRMGGGSGHLYDVIRQEHGIAH